MIVFVEESAVQPDGEDGDTYIDWSSGEHGIRYVEFGDGDNTGQLELGRP